MHVTLFDAYWAAYVEIPKAKAEPKQKQQLD